MFLLDESSSIGRTNFESVKKLVLGLLDTFEIAEDLTRVAIRKYATGTTSVTNLNDFDRDIKKSENYLQHAFSEFLTEA